jgi:hypothetical protein
VNPHTALKPLTDESPRDSGVLVVRIIFSGLTPRYTDVLALLRFRGEWERVHAHSSGNMRLFSRNLRMAASRWAPVVPSGRMILIRMARSFEPAE